jgi:hypothetical protein
MTTDCRAAVADVAFAIDLIVAPGERLTANACSPDSAAQPIRPGCSQVMSRVGMARSSAS